MPDVCFWSWAPSPPRKQLWAGGPQVEAALPASRASGAKVQMFVFPKAQMLKS